MRVRELEEQKMAEDGLRVHIRELENELAMRRARTDHLKATIDHATSQNRANAAAVYYQSSRRHALWRLMSRSMILPSMQGEEHAKNIIFLPFITADAQSHHFVPQYVMPGGQQAKLYPPTMSRSSSEESLESHPNKKQRRNYFLLGKKWNGFHIRNFVIFLLTVMENSSRL